MTDIRALIDQQKAINDPPPPPSETEERLQRLIARADAEYDNPTWEPVEVVLAGEVLTIELAKIRGSDWNYLEGSHPPVTPEDRNTGYNRRTLPRDYSVGRIKIDGETPDQETWRDLYDVLEATHQENVSALMWGLNVAEPLAELGRLKAAAIAQ